MAQKPQKMAFRTVELTIKVYICIIRFYQYNGEQYRINTHPHKRFRQTRTDGFGYGDIIQI